MEPKKRRNKLGGIRGKLRVSRPGQGDNWEPDVRQIELFEAVERREKTQREIAADFGITNGRVTQLMKKLRRWKARTTIPSIEQHQQRQISEARWVATEARSAWERSKQNGADDLQCLTVYLKAQEQINKILGINAPEKVDLKGSVDHTMKLVQKDDFYGTNPHALPATADDPSGARLAISGPI